MTTTFSTLSSVAAALARMVPRASVAALALCAGAVADELPDPPRLPELVRTKQTVFALPFRVATPQSADRAAQRVTLAVSRDLGATWQEVGSAEPSAGSITYRATTDGEYWFRFRAIDAQGRPRGGPGPDIRVMVDAAGPRLTARVWRGADGEIICRFAAADDSLRLESLDMAYRGKGDAEWKTIAAEGILARESPAHLVGEQVWWAGEQVESLAVRIAVTDGGGNRTQKEFHLLPADPGVDQAALALELGVPTLPARSVATVEPGQVGQPVELAAPVGVSAAPAGGAAWSPETATRFPLDGPAPAVDPVPSRVRPASSPGPRLGAGAVAPVAPPALAPAARVVQPPREYRGRPLHIVNSRSFSWDYEIETDRPGGGSLQVELWSTLDGGVTWQRSAVDDDAVSPIAVTLPSAGLYGFRMEIVPPGAPADHGPRPGAAPEGWIGVDDEAPAIELARVEEVRPGGTAAVVIQYAARDQMLVPGGVRLLYSPSVDGPWATIAEGLDAQGIYTWQPDRVVPARVYVRAEATDAAGNVGRATTPEVVATSTARAVGRLGGIRVAPTQAQ